MRVPPEDAMRRLLEPSSAELADVVSRSLNRIRRHLPRRSSIPLVLAAVLAVALLWIGVTRDGSPEARHPEPRTLALTNHGRVVLVVDAGENPGRLSPDDLGRLARRAFGHLGSGPP